MRSFSKWDLEILGNLSKIKPASQGQVDDFLNSFFFKQELGRALIIQSQGKYAVFFLTTDLFDSDVQKNEELTKFIDLLSLFKYLLTHGYIAIHRNEKAKDRSSMYFLQDSFINPQPSNGPIILNALGDYTSNPETIHNKDKQIAYKGIVFEHEMYELILSTMTGSLIISQSLKDLVRHRPNNGAHVTLDLMIPTALLFTTLVVLIWLSINTHNKDRVQHQQMQTLVAANPIIQNKLDQLTQRMRDADSIRSRQKNNAITDSYAIPTLYGIDVSKWNGDLEKDLDAVDSLSFVICKATEGKRSTDSYFKANWNLLKARAFIKGAYHFYIVGEDPINQADFFWSVVQQLDSTDLAPIVDIEQGSISSQSKPDPLKLQVELLLFLRHLQTKSGRLPMIYTDVAFANEYLANDAFASYPLWLADYTTRVNPTIPHTWKAKGYKIWQKSDSYAIDSEKTDFDIFLGKREELFN